ncbi:MAG: UbiA family prenyltransferase [Verrucomicrobia bacterium]|nr:UbiA family prenyltransferase [Verrucomicrobiota bacterium]
MISYIRKLGEFVKFSHTIFALPFALAAMLAAFESKLGPAPAPELRIVLLILLAMVGGRTAAMAFNRIVDRKFDANNPRTLMRHLPQRQISFFSAWLLVVLGSTALVVAAWFLNPLCFYLSPVALFIILFYSLTKRFTHYSHFYLGIALGISPIGAWLAVTGAVHAAPILLGLAVVCWVAGFDMIYAMQDEDFDRRTGLHSMVVVLGPRGALAFARMLHGFTVALLLGFGLLSHRRGPFWSGLGIIVFVLLIEHVIAAWRSLKWINVAFFRMNALVSTVLFVAVAADVYLPKRLFTWF